MTDLPQFYSQIAALNSEEHLKLRLKPEIDYGFARNSNAVVITAVEFRKAACHYPIVFVENSGKFMPMAVMGVKADQNLFVSDDGKWNADYIPAYVRRYPFVLAAKERDSENLTVCFDTGYSGLNRRQGEALFDKDGNHTPFLEKIVEFMREYHTQGQVTEIFCNRLKELELLQPVQAQLSLGEGENMSLVGFQAVDREKLKGLPDDVISELLRNDGLELIHVHLASLERFTDLLIRLRDRSPEGEPTDTIPD